jgi:hypothetical protein
LIVIRSFQRSADGAEVGAELRTNALNRGDDRNRDACGDQPVFDSRGARFVFQKRDKSLHLMPALAFLILPEWRGAL